ncbi:MAG: CoA ester lyase [Gammaproteobacteria bacterium]|nr:CoA ester lyase [Gammaproteobacteria bacterium]
MSGRALPRSWLFVPADSERKLAKALDSGADAVILDLEDAVVAARKPLARQMAAAFLQEGARSQAPELWVRVNPLSSGLMPDDLRAVLPAAPAGIMLPKPGSIADVRELDRALGEFEAGTPGRAATPIVAIATESALAVATLSGYVRPPERLLALAWGAEDLSADLGAADSREADGGFRFTYRMVRSLCQITAAASGRAAIETLWPGFRDEAGLARFASRAAEDGFSGMLAIHPAQVPVINAAFTPTAEQVERARRVLAAFAAAPDAGAVQLDGRMLDRPHQLQAQRLLERAR